MSVQRGTEGERKMISTSVVAGLLMILGGISVYLQGTGRLPVSKNMQRQSSWLVTIGPVFKVGGPIMVIGGVLKILISI